MQVPRQRVAQVAAWRVRVVIPYFNRVEDVQRLLWDLAAVGLGGGRIGLSVLVVDNASTQGPAPTAPLGLEVKTVRLATNAGGSGGFSHGMRHWMAVGVRNDPHELIWLLDSDARVDAGALEPLVEVLDRHPELAGVGSMLADPGSGEVFEGGGDVDPGTGELVQELPSDWESRALIPAGYVAACSLLVRRTAIEAAGEMADLFVSGDDVEWCCRVRRVTGLGFAAVPGSIAFHPKPDKMRTWGRYYAARNAFVAMDAAGVCGKRVRFRRAMREVGRAAAQVMVGRDDLAALHMKGLADVGKRGAAGEGVISFEAWRPMAELGDAVREAVRASRGRVMVRRDVVSDMSELMKTLNAVCVAPDVEGAGVGGGEGGKVLGKLGLVISRLIRGPRHGVAVVSARARAEDWLAGRVVISVDEGAGGFVVRRVGRVRCAMKVAGVVWRGIVRAVGTAMAKGEEAGVRGVVAAEGAGGTTVSHSRGRGPTLSVVVLSHNRWPALEKTLRAVLGDEGARGAEVVVVDNASTDGTPGRVASTFPGVRVVALKENVGIGAFNEGVAVSRGEAVLILDDDSWPREGVVGEALELMASRPDVSAVSLHPVHPESKASEWAFASGGGGASERWPVMGCGNLVRRTAWDRVGGYERSFFLYRNDVDLALKLLSSGHRVHFDPAWVVWHDSPAGAGGKKSKRWFELALRNWMWMCRRHGRGLVKWKGMVAGWLWAHKLAGVSCAGHIAVLRGAWAGLIGRRPKLPRGVNGRGLGELLRVRMGKGAGATTAK